MKRLFISGLLLLTCLLAAAKEIKTVKAPYFGGCNMLKMEITKVVLYSDSTVIDANIYGRPAEEVDIAASAILKADGQNYKLLSKHGFASEGYTKLSAEGILNAKLVFEAIPPETEAFDFTENVENGWSIYAVRLDGFCPRAQIPDRLINQKLDYDVPLPVPSPECGKVRIRGTLLGYLPQAPIPVSYRVKDWVCWDFRPVTVPLNPDGTFLLEDILMSPGLKELRIGPLKLQLFVVPGGELDITINYPAMLYSSTHLFRKEFAKERTVWFEGDYAGLNEELALNPYEMSVVKSLKNIGTLSVQQLKKNVLEHYQKTRKAILKDSKIGKTYRHFALLELTGNTFSNVSGAKYIISYAERKKGEKRGSLAMDEHYYDEILQLDSLSSPYMMFTEDYMIIAENIRNQFPDKMPVPSLWRDFELTHKLSSSLTGIVPLTEQELAVLDTISEPAIREYVMEKNQINIKKLESVTGKIGYTVCELDTAVRNGDILKTVLAPHKGKVVLIDLWATWCGPCMRAMKNMQPMKEALKGKDIVYLFLTNQTSPEGLWKITIPDIHGQHYRLTNEQWMDVCNAYDFPGIPAYLVVDKKGEIVYKNVGFPGVETMKQKLSDALIE